MPKPVEFSVGAAAQRPAAGAVHAAAAERNVDVRTGRRFDLVALEWRGASQVKIELRTRLSGGRWSRWADASAGGDGPDAREGSGPARTFSDPIWVGGADRVQLRLARPVRGLRVRLVNTTGSATAADRAKTRAQVARRGAFGVVPKAPVTNAAAPRIVPRADWGASRCKPRVTPAYGTVKVAYVHHTESINGYSRARAASLVLGICLFHRDTHGWNDIGYDFLVDRYGDVFEGRAGGVDAPVIGAQAGGFNSESTGVSMIGSFSSSAPPPAAMNALAKLLAWKLALHGVPAIGRTQVTSAGGSSTGYGAGTRVTVNRISGHRDVDQTACPGNALYARLPALRRTVARLEGSYSQLAIAPLAQSSAFGSLVPVAGRLTVPDGASPEGAAIELRRFQGFGDATVARASAAADGSFSVLLPPVPGNAAIRAVFGGDAGRPGAVSGTGYVTVAPRVALSVGASFVPAGASVTASGSVAPGKARATVTAYLRRADGSQRAAVTRTVSVRNGAFSVRLPLADAGSYRLVARVGADARSSAGRSQAVAVLAVPPD